MTNDRIVIPAPNNVMTPDEIAEVRAEIGRMSDDLLDMYHAAFAASSWVAPYQWNRLNEVHRIAYQASWNVPAYGGDRLLDLLGKARRIHKYGQEDQARV